MTKIRKTMVLAVSLMMLFAIFAGGGYINQTTTPAQASTVQATTESTGGWFFGDAHTHSFWSDGWGTVLNNVNHARNFREPTTGNPAPASGGMQWLVATDHDTFAQRQEVERINNIDGFLVMTGIEMSVADTVAGWQNHLLAFGVGEEVYEGYGVIDMYQSKFPSPQRAVDRVRELGGIVYLAHPMSNVSVNYRWNRNTQNFHGLEVWNSSARWNSEPGMSGSWDDVCGVATFAWWDELNRAGRRVYGMATSDAHSIAAVGSAGIKMWMDELNEENFLNGLRRGTFYGSNGPDLTFAVGDHMMGSNFHITAPTQVTITVGGAVGQRHLANNASNTVTE